MERKILLVSDSLEIREEVLNYALNFAERIDSLVVALFLLKRGECENEMNNFTKILGLYQQKFAGENVYFEGWVRVGNPLSEFLKFIAGTGSYQAIIWGGKEEINFKKSSSVNEHWLKKAAILAHCPLLMLTKK